MKQALLQRASVTQQEVLAIPSTPASASLLQPACHLLVSAYHRTEEMPSLSHKCLLLSAGPSGPQALHQLWLSAVSSDPGTFLKNGFSLGSSGSHSARTISQSQNKIAFLKVLQVSLFTFCSREEFFKSVSIALAFPSTPPPICFWPVLIYLTPNRH